MTAADGKIYMMNFDANVFAVQAGGTEFTLLHSANLKDPGDDTRRRSSVAIALGNLFVRTGTKLFAIGKRANGEVGAVSKACSPTKTVAATPTCGSRGKSHS